MGKQRTPQGHASGRAAPPRRSPVEALQAALPPTVPDAAMKRPDPLTRSIAQAIHEPPHASPLDRASPVAHADASAGPSEAMPDGPVPDDANTSESSIEDLSETAPAIVAEPVVEAGSAPQPESSAASDPYANVVPLRAPDPVVARLPEPIVVPAEPDAPSVAVSASALPAPASWRAGHRPAPPLRQDLEGMGETLFAFMRTESTAALAHLAALKDVRSPADAIRLQVGEIQRAADASLTCWSEIARRATRIVGQR